MARFIVKLRGKTIYDVTLSDDRSYVVGRKEDCDMVLQPEKGISREHFKVHFQNGQWEVEVISRYGDLSWAGQKVQKVELTHGTHFSLTPYEFEYSEAGQPATLQQLADSESEQPEAGFDEKTVVGVANTIPFVKVLGPTGDAKETFKLDAGDSWIAGRDAVCQIQIRDQRVSRKQFEVKKSGSQYHLFDLESVNGTFLNGTPVSSTTPTVLRSGDSITVLDNVLMFELHDPNYQSKVEGLHLPAMANQFDFQNQDAINELALRGDHSVATVGTNLPQMQLTRSGLMPAPYQQGQENYPQPWNHQQGMPQGDPSQFNKKNFFEKNRPFVIGAAILILAIGYFLSESPEAEKPQIQKMAAVPGSREDVYNRLPEDKKMLVKSYLKDASALYQAGKYELSQGVVQKINEIVPGGYEDSKEIENRASEGIKLEAMQKKAQKQEEEAVANEEKINKEITQCEAKITPEWNQDTLNECLSVAKTINASHPRIEPLVAKVNEYIAAKEKKASDERDYRDRVSRLKAVYDKAVSLESKGGNPLEIIAAYEKVISQNLPDPNGYKSLSQRQIASINQGMNTKTQTFTKEADSLYKAGKLRDAIKSLRQAKKADPRNYALQDRIDQIMQELRKEMMKYYQEGILEESFGNVDGSDSKQGAKDKWKKIIQTDIEDGEYYKKAFIKLKKYGAL